MCLGVSSLEQKPLFVSLSVGQHHFIISVFYKKDISVPCFMVAVIHKATTWVFQQKVHSFAHGEVEMHILVSLLRTFLSCAAELLQKATLKKKGTKEKRNKTRLMHSLHSFTFSLNIGSRHLLRGYVSVSFHRLGRIIELKCSCFAA